MKARRREGPVLEYMTVPFVQTGGSSISFHRSANKTSGARFLGGFATRYQKPHVHRGDIEIMGRGCFAPSLAKQTIVRFLLGHDESQLVATTADDLEIRSDDVGLAFVLRVPDTEIGSKTYSSVASGDCVGMSVGYEALEREAKVIGGEHCYIVRAARLNEISLVHKGAVSQAYAKVIDRPDFSLILDTEAGADRAASDTRTDALRNRGKAAASAVSESFRELARLLDSFERSTSPST